MTRVAIVIVTYNSAAEIGECLDSLDLVPDAEQCLADFRERCSKRQADTTYQRVHIA